MNYRIASAPVRPVGRTPAAIAKTIGTHRDPDCRAHRSQCRPRTGALAFAQDEAGGEKAGRACGARGAAAGPPRRKASSSSNRCS